MTDGSAAVSATGWGVRATAWELAALSFRVPDATLAEALASGELREAALEVAAVLGLGLPDGWADGFAPGSEGDPGALMHGLRAEHTHLFVGAPEPAVSPFEGVWAAGDDGVQPLLFVNPKSMAVERFCRACGLGRPEGTNEPLDFVATECELLSYLAFLAGGAEAPEGAPAPEDLPGGSPAAAYGDFLSDHARAWMPRFAEAGEAASRIPFYRSAARLLAALVA